MVPRVLEKARERSSFVSLDEQEARVFFAYLRVIVLQTMSRKVSSTPGSLVEEKATGLAFHYRACDPSLVEKVKQLREELAALPTQGEFEVLPGAKVIEAGMRGVSKGRIVESVVSELGDDRTDEEMFAAAPPWAITIHVGRARSRAEFRVDDSWVLRDLLEQLVIEARVQDVGCA